MVVRGEVISWASPQRAHHPRLSLFQRLLEMLLRVVLLHFFLPEPVHLPKLHGVIDCHRCFPFLLLDGDSWFVDGDCCDYCYHRPHVRVHPGCSVYYSCPTVHRLFHHHRLFLDDDRRAPLPVLLVHYSRCHHHLVRYPRLVRYRHPCWDDCTTFLPGVDNRHPPPAWGVIRSHKIVVGGRTWAAFQRAWVRDRFGTFGRIQRGHPSEYEADADEPPSAAVHADCIAHTAAVPFRGPVPLLPC
mmetsp:Transcript_39101/g.45598  ORF Transcript_39101/g.45598 Transcript_39101/m.45598 type:complete len:243 (+) Transcript_39101:282-1010(+)